MQKIFQVLGSFFLSLFQGSHAEPLTYEKLVDDIFARLAKVMSKATFGLSGVLLIMSGFLAAYFNLLNQYDQTGTILVGAVASGGFVLMFLGSVLIYISARKPMTERLGPALAQEQAARETSSSSTLEQALAALVLDYIEERKRDRATSENREGKKSQFEPASNFSQDGEEFTIQ